MTQAALCLWHLSGMSHMSWNISLLGLDLHSSHHYRVLLFLHLGNSYLVGRS